MPVANDPMKLDLSAAECIATASTEGDGRDRWTVLSMFVLPAGAPKRFVAQSEAMSCIPGEVTKTRRLAAGTIARALKLFDETDLGIVVRETALEWEEDQQKIVAITDQMALEQLYGRDLKGRKGYAGLVASDFGVGESTVRMAIANGTAIKVPLAAIVPFIDPALLARVREMRNGE